MEYYYLIWHDMLLDRSGRYQYNGDWVAFPSRESADRFREKLCRYFGTRYLYSVRSNTQQARIDKLNKKYGG